MKRNTQNSSNNHIPTSCDPGAGMLCTFGFSALPGWGFGLVIGDHPGNNSPEPQPLGFSATVQNVWEHGWAHTHTRVHGILYSSEIASSRPSQLCVPRRRPAVEIKLVGNVPG